MNEKEIREMIKEKGIDNIDWSEISKCYSLSEDFIREFKDRLN